MARNYAALPYEYKREMTALSDAEFGRLCRALIDYSENGTPIALCGNERFYAERVMMQEDRFKKSYDTTANKNRENGLKGGRPKTQTNPKIPKQIQKTETETETETETNTNTLTPNGVKSSTRFAPPTLDEVDEYCRERGKGVDAERFVNFYAAKGWKVGNQPMKDWKAAVRTWERRDDSRNDRPLKPGGSHVVQTQPVKPGENVARMREYLKQSKEGN